MGCVVYDIHNVTGARCDYGIYLGASATNWSRLHRLSSQAIVAENVPQPNIHFTATRYNGGPVGEHMGHVACILGVTDVSTCVGLYLLLFQHFDNWPKDKLICVHAEERTTAAVLLLAELYQRSVHVCQQ